MLDKPLKEYRIFLKKKFKKNSTPLPQESSPSNFQHKAFGGRGSGSAGFGHEKYSKK